MATTRNLTVITKLTEKWGYDETDAAAWWRDAVIYQIYPRSWADADGDGMGDLPGITARLSHLAELGVDAVWLSPFYTSPQHDAGYDVADYRDVDPRFGTLADADALIARAHELGLRVLVDIVPNHSSSEHPWFQEALAAGPGSPARARYMFRDGRGRARRAAAEQLAEQLRRAGVDAGDRGRREPGPVVPPPLRHDPARLRLDQPRGRRRDGVGAAVLARPRGRRLPDRRRPRTGQGPRTARRSGRAPTTPRRSAPPSCRCGTSPASTTSTVAGARSPTPTRSRARTPTGSWCAEAWVLPTESLASTSAPDELHQSFNFGFLMTPWIAGEMRDRDHRVARGGGGSRRAADVGAVEPRRGPPRLAARLRPGARPAADARHRRRRPAARRGGGAAPRAGRDDGDARAARLGVPLPGGGAGPARGDRAARRGAAGPDLGAVGPRQPRSRRVPGPDAVGGRRAVVRLRAVGARPGCRSPRRTASWRSTARPVSRVRPSSSTGRCCGCAASTASAWASCPGSTSARTCWPST